MKGRLHEEDLRVLREIVSRMRHKNCLLEATCGTPIRNHASRAADAYAVTGMIDRLYSLFRVVVVDCTLHGRLLIIWTKQTV